MSKFMLSMALLAGSLIGLAGAAQAQLPQPGPLPLPGGTAPAPWWDAIIGDHWTTPDPAKQEGEQGLFDGTITQYDVVQGPDGYYYLRVAYPHP